MTDRTAMVGVIIRADGTVPFDDDCHPHVREAILKHLDAKGHKVIITDGIVKIHGWKPPHKA